MRGIEDKLSKGNYVPSKKMPTFKKVGTDWLEQKKQNIRPSSADMYQGHLTYHFEEMNDLKVDRITTAMVEKFITKRQEAGMNISTLRKIIVTFNQVMNYCVRHKYISYNPVRDAERPKDQGSEEKGKIRILTPEQINSFLGCVSKQKYRTLFMLAIMSGARQGELLGLKWSDIDWKNNQVHIQRSYNKRTWYKPKTKTSNRRIDIGPTMISELRKWKLACPINEYDLIFPTETGQPLGQANMVNKYFKPALKKAGLPIIRFHDLRHTYASLMIEKGENIKYIQMQLGHADPNVTLKVYAHLMKPVNQEAAIGLENMIFETSGSKMVAKQEKGLARIELNP